MIESYVESLAMDFKFEIKWVFLGKVVQQMSPLYWLERLAHTEVAWVQILSGQPQIDLSGSLFTSECFIFGVTFYDDNFYIICSIL